jgi:hypothetical protein
MELVEVHVKVLLTQHFPAETKWNIALGLYRWHNFQSQMAHTYRSDSLWLWSYDNLNLTKIKICEQMITKVSISEFTIYVQNQQIQSQYNHDKGNKNIAHISSLGHCFPNFLVLRPLWIQKTTTDPHILTHINIECTDNKHSKLNIYISELILVRYW